MAWDEQGSSKRMTSNCHNEELVAAHAANDRAVLAAYGLKPRLCQGYCGQADTPEPEIVAHLFKLYAEMTKEA